MCGDVQQFRKFHFPFFAEIWNYDNKSRWPKSAKFLNIPYQCIIQIAIKFKDVPHHVVIYARSFHLHCNLIAID